ncbi:MAG: transposase [Pseudonocardiaceae bacterium]
MRSKIGPDAIAALAGLVPVTRASGKHRAVSFRWACNKRLRVALTTFADNSRHASPWAAAIYARARATGKDHPIRVDTEGVMGRRAGRAGVPGRR